MFSFLCPEFHTLIWVLLWKKTCSMSTYSSSSTEQTSAEVKCTVFCGGSHQLQGNNSSRQLALGKSLITSSLQELSCTSLVRCYIFHLGGNTVKVGNTRAPLQPLCWFLDCPTLQSHWLVSIWAHTGRLHCRSHSRPVLLRVHPTTLEFIHFHLELPSHCCLSLGADCVAVGSSQCVLWPWVSWVQGRFSLPFAARLHI